MEPGSTGVGRLDEHARPRAARRPIPVRNGCDITYRRSDRLSTSRRHGAPQRTRRSPDTRPNPGDIGRGSRPDAGRRSIGRPRANSSCLPTSATRAEREAAGQTPRPTRRRGLATGLPPAGRCATPPGGTLRLASRAHATTRHHRGDEVPCPRSSGCGRCHEAKLRPPRVLANQARATEIRPQYGQLQRSNEPSGFQHRTAADQPDPQPPSWPHASPQSGEPHGFRMRTQHLQAVRRNLASRWGGASAGAASASVRRSPRAVERSGPLRQRTGRLKAVRSLGSYN